MGEAASFLISSMAASLAREQTSYPQDQ
jgi:hypothetical protein